MTISGLVLLIACERSVPAAGAQMVRKSEMSLRTALEAKHVSQAEPVDALRTGARTTDSEGPMLQRGLVVLQWACHCCCRQERVCSPQAAGYSQTQRESLYRTIEGRFYAIPGVKNVGIGLYTDGGQPLRYRRAGPVAGP